MKAQKVFLLTKNDKKPMKGKFSPFMGCFYEVP